MYFLWLIKAFLTGIVWWHRPQIIVELSSPFRGWFQSVNFEQIIQEGEEHWIVVGKDEQVHCQKVSTGLYNTIDRKIQILNEWGLPWDSQRDGLCPHSWLIPVWRLASSSLAASVRGWTEWGDWAPARTCQKGGSLSPLVPGWYTWTWEWGEQTAGAGY